MNMAMPRRRRLLRIAPLVVLASAGGMQAAIVQASGWNWINRTALLLDAVGIPTVLWIYRRIDKRENAA